MKQAVIAIVVCTASAGLGYSLLYSHPQPAPIKSDITPVKTLSVRSDKSDRLPAKPVEIATADETASISDDGAMTPDKTVVTADIEQLKQPLPAPSEELSLGLKSLSQ